jgi:4-hydroxy-tetrahydrodipicolinate synthase
LRLVELAVQVAAGRVPVIAGAGSNCTTTAIELAQQAERLGADGILSVVPYYNRPSQEGIYQHFKTVQSCTDLPILLYDVPSRTGTGLTVKTIRRLAELPNIAGLKDASGDIDRVKTLRQVLSDEFLLLCGDDARVADYLALGSEGCISVAGNVVPALCSALHHAWTDKDLERFQRLHSALDILNEALFVETNPIPVKWALAFMGLIGDELRLPLTPLAKEWQPTVIHALNSVVALEGETAAGIPSFGQVASSQPRDIMPRDRGGLP